MIALQLTYFAVEAAPKDLFDVLGEGEGSNGRGGGGRGLVPSSSILASMAFSLVIVLRLLLF